MMTKKHYKAIAEIIRKGQIESSPINGVLLITERAFIEALTKFFKSDNPNFNEKKFLQAVQK